MTWTQGGDALFQGALRFQEVQKFARNPISAIAGIGLVGGAVGSFACGINVGNVILLLVLAAVAFLLLFGELRTEVRDEGLYTRLFPLTRQHRFSWAEIQSCEARTFRPLFEHGGWGLRCTRDGKAYTVSGNRGVQLEFADGKRLLIGSQRADDLAIAIGEMLGRR